MRLNNAGIQARYIEQRIEQRRKRLQRTIDAFNDLARPGFANAVVKRMHEQRYGMQRLTQIMARRG
jgi:hypothetical protein